MNYSESILGTSLDDLSLEILTNYFNDPRNESNIVEYKSFNPRGDFEPILKGLYRSVGAFLNSEVDCWFGALLKEQLHLELQKSHLMVL